MKFYWWLLILAGVAGLAFYLGTAHEASKSPCLKQGKKEEKKQTPEKKSPAGE